MTTRLQQAFKTLRETGRKGVVPYITAGDPGLATTYDLLVAMAHGGAAAIEVGMPFSHPAADGPVIQRACERALARGVKLNAVLEIAARAVETTGVPIVLFSYLNPLLRHGLDKLAQDAADAALAGVLVTDLPAESAQGFSWPCSGATSTWFRSLPRPRPSSALPRSRSTPPASFTPSRSPESPEPGSS